MESNRDLYAVNIVHFNTNEDRDKVYSEVMIALEEWALQAKRYTNIGDKTWMRESDEVQRINR